MHKKDPGTEVPHLIQRIDDRDRWVFQYDDSRALHAGLATLKPWSFPQWQAVVRDTTPMFGGSSTEWNKLVATGQTVLNVYNDQIRDRVRVAEKCRIEYDFGETTCVDQEEPIRTYKFASGLAVNSPIHQSEIGNELAKASGTYGLVWYYDAATQRANVSLRSIGDYDVSAIAKALGGGGHKNAAGFNIDMPTLLGWLK